MNLEIDCLVTYSFFITNKGKIHEEKFIMYTVQ